MVHEFSSHTSVIQMDPNQETEQVTHCPSMASSPTTTSGTLPPYFRLNYLPSIPTSLIFLSFPPPNKFLLLSNSFSSLQAMQGPHSSNPIVQRILILLHSMAFLWIPGHINLLDHDAVDFAAKQSLLFTKITDPSFSPAYDLKTYYDSFITSSWHNIWHTQPLTKLRSIKETSKLHGPLQIVHLAMKK